MGSLLSRVSAGVGQALRGSGGAPGGRPRGTARDAGGGAGMLGAAARALSARRGTGPVPRGRRGVSGRPGRGARAGAGGIGGMVVRELTRDPQRNARLARSGLQALQRMRRPR